MTGQVTMGAAVIRHLKKRPALQQLLIFILLAANIELLAFYLLRAEGFETDSGIAQRHATRGWRMKLTPRSAASINSDGLRGPELPATPPAGELRILCLGGSVTFGSGGEERDCYPRQLETILNRSGSFPRVRVINGGTPGWSTHQFMSLLVEMAPRVRPHIVMVMCGFNDCLADAYRRLEPEAAHGIFERRPYLDAARGALLHCATYRYLAYRLRPAPPGKLPEVATVPGDPQSTLPDETRSLSNSVDNLTILHRYTRIHGYRLLLLEEAHRTTTLPAYTAGSGGHGPAPYKREDYLAYLRRLRDAHQDLARRLSIPFMDMDPVISACGQGEGQVFQGAIDPIHYTALGNRLAAQAIADRLRELDWLRIP